MHKNGVMNERTRLRQMPSTFFFNSFRLLISANRKERKICATITSFLTWDKKMLRNVSLRFVHQKTKTHTAHNPPSTQITRNNRVFPKLEETQSWHCCQLLLIPYPEIGDANFKCALWIFEQRLALKMRARCGISIVLL